ncbi:MULTISPECIES: cobalamin biosynthesis protein [Pseudonocardia]|uniref:Cobalamin biosynthesis protein CobD n=2 Tax=Pseudonocardia TaxID=1847 RepID=A0A1Y2MT02_PSEAH|nr:MULTISPECIES: cobalamin biosynthesis protein [Pseudonocardia]OSY37877.1 cobalamin biosynthesis protein [Pseudonocardia autotrophica]TDN72460.1 adenosylcobinamide-phosphate synthase [Pseudonocardia autotrophica]BBG03169.1 cobalamin biosynthesis protein CobD [Pseudonocardia autotrophica]GEC23785.1 cobalamin biosynthesis protein CobD [Pseudonocardia saturnea]
MRDGARAAGLMIGILADAMLGDPRRGHPVAAFGTLAAGLERWLYRDSRVAGAVYAVVLVGGTVAAGVPAGRVGGPVTRTAVTAVSTWAVLGGTSLIGEGAALAAALAADDRAAARTRVTHLCARDPALLDPDGMARAGVESLAENTSDAVVGPLVWGAVAGVPGLLGYRAVNTLDAMVGYRSARYERFGWACARLDDLVNLVPSRVTALLTVAIAPLVGGSSRAALRAWRRDAAGHPSPNAGPVEATAAGALGLRLGGPTTYAHGTENRPALGDGHPPRQGDLVRAARLSRLVAAAAGALAVGVAYATGRPRSGGVHPEPLTR